MDTPGDLSFDSASDVTAEISAADAALVAQRIRQIGVSRVLYGSGRRPPGGGLRRGWEMFTTKIPLSPAEWQQSAQNRIRLAKRDPAAGR